MTSELNQNKEEDTPSWVMGIILVLGLMSVGFIFLSGFCTCYLLYVID